MNWLMSPPPLTARTEQRQGGRELTEQDIQFAIYGLRRWKEPFPVMVPNVYIWHWESDILYLTRAGYPWEYEIKLTHSDFLADAKKQTKHSSLQNGSGSGPAHFYYACPKDVITVEELPEYAGLIYVSDETSRYGYLHSRIIKPAPRRKVKKLPDSQIQELLKKGVSRYWSLQTRLALTPPRTATTSRER